MASGQTKLTNHFEHSLYVFGNSIHANWIEDCVSMNLAICICSAWATPTKRFGDFRRWCAFISNRIIAEHACNSCKIVCSHFVVEDCLAYVCLPLGSSGDVRTSNRQCQWNRQWNCSSIQYDVRTSCVYNSIIVRCHTLKRYCFKENKLHARARANVLHARMGLWHDCHECFYGRSSFYCVFFIF